MRMGRSQEKTRREEQAARNEILFRNANETLGAKREALELEGRTPFLCECEEPTCTELIHLALEEYEHVRSHANWFLVVTGHDAETGRPAESHGTYVIVEKSGLAGRIAEEENPRR
jgi:hypothetical protein